MSVRLSWESFPCFTKSVPAFAFARWFGSLFKERRVCSGCLEPSNLQKFISTFIWPFLKKQIDKKTICVLDGICTLCRLFNFMSHNVLLHNICPSRDSKESSSLVLAVPDRGREAGDTLRRLPRPVSTGGSVGRLLQICRQGLQDNMADGSLPRPTCTGCTQPASGLTRLPAGLLAPLSAACSLWKLNVWRKVLPVRYESRQTNATDVCVC